MNAKTLMLMVLGVALFWGGTRMFNPGESEQDQNRSQDEQLFPSLQEHVNEVYGLELVIGEGTFHFERGSGGLWTLLERDNYPADRKKLDGLVLALARSKRLEQKTSKPARYAALGLAVETPGSVENAKDPEVKQESAGSVHITSVIGETMASLWVGNRRGHSATEAYFVRKQGEAVCWAASGNLALDSSMLAWLDSTLVDIASAEIQSVRITHPDGEQVLLSRPKDAAQNAPLTILNLPEGKEAQSEWVTSRFASALQGFKLQDVQPASQSSVPEGQTTRSEFWTLDGLRITLVTWEKEGSIYATAEADVSSEGTRLAYSGPEVDGQAAIDLQGDSPEAPSAPEYDVDARAKQLNQRFAGWVYVLPSWKGAALRGRMGELLKAEGDESDPFGDTPADLAPPEPEQVLTVQPEAELPIAEPEVTTPPKVVTPPKEPTPEPQPEPKTPDPVFEIDPEGVKNKKKPDGDLVTKPE